jgi:hypothetical protein
MGGNALHNLAHAVFILSKISHSTKPMVIMHFFTTAAFWGETANPRKRGVSKSFKGNKWREEKNISGN